MVSEPPRPFARRVALLQASLALAALVAAPGCDIQVREGGDVKVGLYSAEARQEWVRTYTVAPAGLIEVANLNGPIDVTQGAAGSAVEVRADITAKALTDAGAKEVLSRGRIDEAASPERVKIETVIPRGGRGSYQVHYHVRVPPGVDAQVSTTNGNLKAEGITSRLKASIVNGQVDFTAMSGPIDTAVVNGTLTAKLAAVTAPVRLETTNGRITLDLPKASKANLTARVVNGGLMVTGLPLEQPPQRRIRNLEAALNGGGPAIDLRTTNGRITINGTP